MITSVELFNFKCFRQVTVPFGGLTVLTGLNGSGKSTVIQSLLVLSESPRVP
ncbi:AAA family ATPase [Stenotrophomonas rhizophila]|uniref:AAA family ATPase n=1 Tax=Stenotrophomonas TaxID=40323 RepID=UPI003B9DC829